MQILDVKFDGQQGELQVDEEKGVLKVIVKENNPSFPSGLTVNVPLDDMLQKLADKQSNVFAKWGIKIAKGIIDAL